jgi:hypothetical protein
MKKMISMKETTVPPSPAPVAARWVVVEEKKDDESPPSPVPTSLSVSTLSRSTARAEMMGRLCGVANGHGSGWANYTVRLPAAVVVASTSGGVIAASFLADPSNIPLYEWSTFAALFDEVKCVGFEVWLSPNSDTANLINAGLAVGSFTRSVSVPASYTAVLVAPDSVLASPSNTTKLAYRHKMKYPRDILFAPTASPAPGPYAGCPGSIQIYSTGNQANVSALTVFVVGTYRLRGRL